MLRTHLLVLILASSSLLFAQRDFTRADTFAIGDSASYLAVDATGLNPGPAGNGITWDFSNLTRIPAEDYETRWDSPNVAPNQADFPGANLVEIQDLEDTTGYTFFDVSDSRFILLGLDLPDVGVLTYSDTNLWINFPLSFGESQNDDFVGTYTSTELGPPTIVNRTGNLMTTYDGYGTIILPDGTVVNDVIRLKLNQTIDDVINASGITVTTRVITETYEWFKQGVPGPIFQVTFGDTTITPPGQTFSSVSATYQGVDGSGNTPSFAGKNRGAHLTAQGGNFDTQVLVQNPSGAPNTLTLTPYNNSGSDLNSVDVNVTGNGVNRALQDTLFPADAGSFVSDGCSSCVFSVGYRAAGIDNASTAHVHQTDRFETEFTVIPGEWSVLFDGVAVINNGDQVAAVEAVQIGPDGNVIRAETLNAALAPGAKQLSIFNTIFDEVPGSVVKLRSAQPMAVMVLRISTDGRFLYQNVPLPKPRDLGEVRYLAHITSETGGFDTDIIAHNLGDTQGVVGILPFDSDGNALDGAEISLAPGETKTFLKTELLDPAASHALVTGSVDCVVSTGYRARVADASTAPVHETELIEDSFLVYPGEWDILFDGIALVNAGGEPATITVDQIDDNGNVLDTVTLVDGLAVNAKFLGVLEGQLEANPDTILRFNTNQPLAVLTLRLSKDARFLYNNPPLPRDE